MIQNRYYLQNCKATMHLEKLQIMQNINNLILQVIFIFSDEILVKQIIVFSTPLCCWEKTDFQKNLPGVLSGKGCMSKK